MNIISKETHIGSNKKMVSFDGYDLGNMSDSLPSESLYYLYYMPNDDGQVHDFRKNLYKIHAVMDSDNIDYVARNKSMLNIHYSNNTVDSFMLDDDATINVTDDFIHVTSLVIRDKSINTRCSKEPITYDMIKALGKLSVRANDLSNETEYYINTNKVSALYSNKIVQTKYDAELYDTTLNFVKGNKLNIATNTNIIFD